MQQLTFIQLNENWDAEPNAPSVHVEFNNGTAELSFMLNSWRDKSIKQLATIRFTNCSRWNWDATNDHAWFAGEGRYAKQAPKWGEFYEVIGEETLGGDIDWEIMSTDPVNARHFLFYFRDETLEFIAADWSISIDTLPPR
ncbi:hypothetical protein [Shinella sp.]|uniref:hypothetical protein n=1 Tax=Shinella sp. TaxID=1870904 RepID=UPI0028A584C8|nr:hypothetical protein [Shinella sp.]